MRFVFAALMLTLIGCATRPTKFSQLSVGMQKSEVVTILGQPASVSATDNIEYLVYEYNLYPSGVPAKGGPDRHFVKIVDGRVASFGRVGDFDSTKPSESTVNVNVKSK